MGMTTIPRNRALLRIRSSSRRLVFSSSTTASDSLPVEDYEHKGTKLSVGLPRLVRCDFKLSPTWLAYALPAGEMRTAAASLHSTAVEPLGGEGVWDLGSRFHRSLRLRLMYADNAKARNERWPSTLIFTGPWPERLFYDMKPPSGLQRGWSGTWTSVLAALDERQRETVRSRLGPLRREVELERRRMMDAPTARLLLGEEEARKQRSRVLWSTNGDDDDECHVGLLVADCVSG